MTISKQNAILKNWTCFITFFASTLNALNIAILYIKLTVCLEEMLQFKYMFRIFTIRILRHAALI